MSVTVIKQAGDAELIKLFSVIFENQEILLFFVIIVCVIVILVNNDNGDEIVKT